jgi:hypothetical protein
LSEKDAESAIERLKNKIIEIMDNIGPNMKIEKTFLPVNNWQNHIL